MANTSTKNKKNLKEQDTGVHHHIQKLATEMSKLVEDLEENVNILNSQKKSPQERTQKQNSKLSNENEKNSSNKAKICKANTNFVNKKASNSSGSSNGSRNTKITSNKNQKNARNSTRRTPRSAPTLRRPTAQTVYNRPNSATSGSSSISSQTSQASRTNRVPNNNKSTTFKKNSINSLSQYPTILIQSYMSAMKPIMPISTLKLAALPKLSTNNKLSALSPPKIIKSTFSTNSNNKTNNKNNNNDNVKNNMNNNKINNSNTNSKTATNTNNNKVITSDSSKVDNNNHTKILNNVNKNTTNDVNRPSTPRSIPQTNNNTVVSNKPLIVMPIPTNKVNPSTTRPLSPDKTQLVHIKTDNLNTMPNKYMTETEMLSFLKRNVERAIRERKTFTVCGNYYTIRKALISRGWVEKVRLSYNFPDRNNLRALEAKSINELLPLANSKQNGQYVQTMIMSKLLGKHQVDLYWDQSYDAYKVNPDNVKFTLINNIKRGMLSYASKQGLCEAMKRAHWYQKPGVSYIRHPRSYSLTNSGDPDQFITDFKITAAMSLLKWIVLSNESTIPKLLSPSGKVPVSVFHFAISECTKFLKKCKHEDIDNPVEEAMDYQWNEFLENYYKIVHVGTHFNSSHLENEETLVHKSKLMLKKLKKYWSNLYMDGMMNIWILKPVNGSRGIGIHICRTLQYVLKVITENKTCRYVIQKYIERPLLIYNTKFDIRQWFLISSTVPLTIWVYKQCYLRFSSQTYNLRKLHESIHLTNNSVQTRYKNCNRDPSLPEHNMWDSIEFQRYLESIGYPHVWKNTIYAGIRQCIVGAVLVNQEYVCARKNSFELYGADFMLTEDFKPWLIEINSRPALYPSTPVTGKMCPQVLEDVIKVVVDYRRNSKASTGNFKLIYRQGMPRNSQYDTKLLKIEGKAI